MNSLYFRMTFVHYVGIILLIGNAILFTDNIIGQIVQYVVALVVFIHEVDEKINGRSLSFKLKEYLKDIDNTNARLEIDTSWASEYADILHTIQNRNKNVKIKLENDIKSIHILSEKIERGDFSNNLNLSFNSIELKELEVILSNLFLEIDTMINNISVTAHNFVDFKYNSKIDTSNANGVVKELYNKINILGERLNKSSNTTFENGNILKDNSTYLSNFIEDLNNSASLQLDAMNKLRDISQSIQINIKKSNEKTDEMIKISQKTEISAQNGKILTNDTVSAMNEILNTTSSIGDAIGDIDQIAFQTNILSLNAAVEAATAGEAGKGFAVVAAEVRNLAGRSSEASINIRELAEKSQTKATQGKIISNNLNIGFEDLNDKINQMNALIKNFILIFEQQNSIIKGVDRISTELENMITNDKQELKDSVKLAHILSDKAKIMLKSKV